MTLDDGLLQEEVEKDIAKANFNESLLQQADGDFFHN